MKNNTIDKWIIKSFKWYLGGIFCFLVFVVFTQEDPVNLPESYCAPNLVDSSNFKTIIQEGPSGFTNLCSPCHSTNTKERFHLSLLKESLQKWEEVPREELYAFIRNSQKTIQSGHPLAKASWDKWKPAGMPDFDYLSDKELNRIIAFILENG